ncbi:hypothetical protein EVJ20_07050 [Exiguobacterium sp. SH0S1]|uniref:hypothetical protein n=1 Tax=Exiguobacterium sp. SH0S1 TaxID=2510949 RepID=UPI0010401D40|nr:hypothetical protein [Exiguobacterium sp. SH0S1]TCI77712.1 hypothetical protein EVJ20_07050 [Exiguobacterium sp. SH0S1]
MERLQGGDLRSIGRVDEVVQFVGDDSERFAELMVGLTDDRPVVRMRSADAVEKITRRYPELLKAHQAPLLELLPAFTQQEVRWHVAQLMPRLPLSDDEAGQVVRVLKAWIASETSKIVIVNSLQALFDLSVRYSRFHDELIDLLHKQLDTGSPAVRSRCNTLLAKWGE